MALGSAGFFSPEGLQGEKGREQEEGREEVEELLDQGKHQDFYSMNREGGPRKEPLHLPW